VSFMAIDIDVRSALVCNCAFLPEDDDHHSLRTGAGDSE